MVAQMVELVQGHTNLTHIDVYESSWRTDSDMMQFIEDTKSSGKLMGRREIISMHCNCYVSKYEFGNEADALMFMLRWKT